MQNPTIKISKEGWKTLKKMVSEKNEKEVFPSTIKEFGGEIKEFNGEKLVAVFYKGKWCPIYHHHHHNNDNIHKYRLRKSNKYHNNENGKFFYSDYTLDDFIKEKEIPSLESV